MHIEQAGIWLHATLLPTPTNAQGLRVSSHAEVVVWNDGINA